MKHHNNLTDEQIHLPKGFEPASNRSVMTKNTTGGLDWKKANYTSSTTVTCVADAGGNLHHRYFCLYNSNDVVKYAVYFNITGGDAMSLPTGYDIVLEIDVTASGSGSTAAQVGDALQTTLNAHADFTATDDDAGVVTITGTTSSTDPFNVDTGFTISTIQTKLTDELLSTDSTGDISWRGMPEGTEIKSTGETGGTKFLREDGDGTCSWQTVGAGGAGDITSVSLVSDSGTINAMTGAATFTIAGGDGVSTSVAGSTLTVTNDSPDKISLTRNIEGYGSIEYGVEYGSGNGQYNSEHKFTANLGTPDITTITPKNMVNCAHWINPLAGTSVKGWIGYCWGASGTFKLRLLRVNLGCPVPMEMPATLSVCELASTTIVLAGNSNPRCWDVSSFETCGEGWEDSLSKGEALLITAQTESESCSFVYNCQIYLEK